MSTHVASINDRNLSVAQYLGSLAGRHPESLCLLRPQGASVTYGTLLEQIEETRTALTGLGITRRSRVALMLPAHESNIVILLSAMSCAPCAVLNPELPHSELGSILGRVKASVLILPASGNAGAADIATAAGAQVVRVRATSGLPFSVELHADPGVETRATAASNTGVTASPTIDDDALLLFTSGTSAAPKLVALTHRQLLISASNIASALELRSDDRQLGLMPLHHIHGLSTALSTLLSGGSIVCTRGFVEDAFPQCLHDLGVTWYSASPSIHRQIINRMSGTRDGVSTGSRLRFVRSASEKMPLELLAAIEARLGVPVIEAYGMTEASPQISSNRLDPRDRRAGSVGRAAGPEIRIIDANGRTLPSGAVGEIVIKGDSVITRYADSDIDTRHAFIDGWLRTGDEGYLDAEGFLFITGRLDDVINRGGVKVSPARIELVLNNHPVVAEAAVFGVPDNQLGQEVAAAVVLARGGVPGYCDTARYLEYQKTMGELQRDLARQLSRSELPKSFYIVERPPTGPGGKRRRAVPEKFQALIVPAPDPLPAARPAITPTLAESFLLEVCKDVLSTESLTVTDNFFDLGGDSLAAMQLISRINETFPINLPSSAVFDNPTVTGLARFIGSRLADAAVGDRRETAPSGHRVSRAETAAVAGPDQGYALSDVQKQIWFMHRNDVGAAYHVSASLYLSGSLAVATLKQALDEIVARHDSLRAGIRERNGRLEQFVREPDGCQLEVTDLGILPRERRTSVLRELEQSTHDKPFDLARDRLSRFHLVRIDDDQHLLLITLHHIIADGWSVNILYRELSAFYSSLLRHGTIEESKRPPRLAEYAGSVPPGAHTDLDAYWKEKLSDCPAECRFPADHLLPAHVDYHGSVVRSVIDAARYRKLQAAARRHGVTLYVYLLTIFKVLLYRYNGQPDSMIGSAFAGRDQSNQDVIGCFANTVVLRSTPSAGIRFEDYIRSVGRELNNTMDHADVSLMELVHKTDVQRQHGRNPIFQTMFVFHDFPGSLLGTIDGRSTGTGLHHGVIDAGDIVPEQGFNIADGLHAFPWRHDATSTKFDVTLYLKPGRESLFLTWQFRTCLYENASIQRIADNFTRLVEQIVDEPSRPLGDYALTGYRLPASGYAQAHKTGLSRAPEPGFVEQFRQQAARSPDAVAVTARDAQWTYAELDRVSSQVARHLGKLGVGSGTPVALLLDRRIELVALILGLWKAGATYVPCDPAYPPRRLAYALDESRVEFVICDRSTRELLGRDLPDNLVAIDLDAAWPRVLAETAQQPDTIRSPDVPAYIIYTSGSSGHPDKITVNQSNLAYYCSAMKAALELSTNDRYLHTASISFSSSIRQLTVPLVSGSALVLAATPEVRDPQQLYRLMYSRKVTVVDLVPTYWSLISGVFELEQKHDASLRLMLSASEPLPSALYTRLKRYAGPDTRIINMYGQTETTGIVAMHEISGHDESRPTVPVGRPIPGTGIAILDDRQRAVPAGVTGEIYISSPAITRHDLQLNNEIYYRSGDLGRYLHDGSMELVGRKDQQIKIRGHRVEPVEIENYFRLCTEISEVAVEAITAAVRYSTEKVAPIRESDALQLVAFVVFKANNTAEPSSKRWARTRAEARQWLPEYMLPARYVELSNLPLLPSGKTDRAALRRVGDEQSPNETAAPDHQAGNQRFTTTEQELAAIWRRVLEIDAVDRDDNFFDLGGDSLLSVEVIEQARRVDIGISLEDLFQHQTLSSLASVVEQKQGGREPAKRRPAPGREQYALRVSADKLRAFSIEALTSSGLQRAIAETVTEVQLEASLRGQATHNISSIPRYARRIRSGKINAAPELTIIQETPLSAVISGDNGPGQWVAVEAVQLAIRKAKQQGVGMVSVRQSNHFGAAGHYPWLAAREGLIGLCTTNGPVILAPTGGLTPTLGNNPLAVGIPSSRHFPVLLDITMSVAPRGKIGVALAEGQRLPDGWIFDGHGRPSTDLADLAAGLGVPIGGHKGYGLALIMEILAGVLSGSGFGRDHRRELIRQYAEAPDIGHFFLVVDPELFMPVRDFESRTQLLVEQLKSSRRIEGVDEILVPGEKEMRAREVSLAQGVALRKSEYDKLVRLADEMNLTTGLEPMQGPG